MWFYFGEDVWGVGRGGGRGGGGRECFNLLLDFLEVGNGMSLNMVVF